MATDPDGDSQMASSPESNRSLSDVEVDAEAEAGAGSRTPTQTTSPNAQFAGASELSPPGSQTQSTGGVGEFSSAPGIASERKLSEQPGASWRNKRAEEEYQRAMEFVVDQDFNLDEFGDPFDQRDMKERLG